MLHGGYWQPPYTRLIMRPMCVDLARKGFAAWNVEYRRLGRDGGGWPQTFDDVAAAVDHLAELRDHALDLDRVTLLGHSAGGQLALWAGARAALPAGAVGAAPRVLAQRVLAMSAVSDLRRVGEVARQLLGGGPDSSPTARLKPTRSNASRCLCPSGSCTPSTTPRSRCSARATTRRRRARPAATSR